MQNAACILLNKLPILDPVTMCPCEANRIQRHGKADSFAAVAWPGKSRVQSSADSPHHSEGSTNPACPAQLATYSQLKLTDC